MSRSKMTNGAVERFRCPERKEGQARQEANQASRAATLRQVMEHYLIHRRTKHGLLRDRTKEDIRRHCEVNLARWLDRSMAETVTRSACLERFTAMSEEAPAQANLCMKYLRSLCNHARDMFATEGGEYLIFAANPVTQMLKLRKLNPTKARKGRVPKERIGHVWLFLRKEAVEARRDTERTAADWLSCILLSGARKMESGSLECTDIDLAERTLQLRGDVTKNHNELTLPLSSVAYQILSKRLQSQDNSSAARRRRRQRSSLQELPCVGPRRLGRLRHPVSAPLPCAAPRSRAVVCRRVAPLLAYLRELQRRHTLSVLVVHHAKKSSGRIRAGQALRGSSEFQGWGDSNLYLRRTSNMLTLTIEHRAAALRPHSLWSCKLRARPWHCNSLRQSQNQHRAALPSTSALTRHLQKPLVPYPSANCANSAASATPRSINGLPLLPKRDASFVHSKGIA
jgi:hypothetical protein